MSTLMEQAAQGLESFRVVPPNRELRPQDLKLPDGTPMVGPDGLLVPPARSFTMVLNAAQRLFSSRFDEAMRDNFVAARAMRRDAFIRGLLEERILPTINRTWQLEVDDDRDKQQVGVRDTLTALIQGIHDFDALKRALMDATWFGRAGCQWNYVRDPDNRGMWSVGKWDPIHGDSIQFTFDGVPAIMIDTMTAGWYTQHGATRGPGGDVRYTDRGGMALVLCRKHWRERFAVHVHMREKADYLEGELAGSVQGLGLRGLVYWQYVVRTDALTWMLGYMQAVGQMDLLVFNYPSSDAAAKAQQEANAAQIIGKAAIACPRNPTQNWPAVEQIPMNEAGLKALHDLVADYFDRHIERLIVGQSMSSGADNESGLGGTGRAEFAKATKDEILVYDTNRLDETLTRDLVGPLKRYNFPWARFPVRFKSILPNLEAKDKVDSGKVLIEAGVSIKTDEFREAAGYSRPEEGDEVVQPPQQGPGGGEAPPPGNPPGAPPEPGQPPPGPPVLPSHGGDKGGNGKSSFGAPKQLPAGQGNPLAASRYMGAPGGSNTFIPSFGPPGKKHKDIGRIGFTRYDHHHLALPGGTHNVPSPQERRKMAAAVVSDCAGARMMPDDHALDKALSSGVLEEYGRAIQADAARHEFAARSLRDRMAALGAADRELAMIDRGAAIGRRPFVRAGHRLYRAAAAFLATTKARHEASRHRDEEVPAPPLMPATYPVPADPIHAPVVEFHNQQIEAGYNREKDVWTAAAEAVTARNEARAKAREEADKAHADAEDEYFEAYQDYFDVLLDSFEPVAEAVMECEQAIQWRLDQEEREVVAREGYKDPVARRELRHEHNREPGWHHYAGSRRPVFYDAGQAARARRADLIVLPEGVGGTNCGNCSYKNPDVSHCRHPEVDLPITPRHCCVFWDAPGTTRPEQGGTSYNRPFDYATDALGNEHREAGAGGGQFTGKGDGSGGQKRQPPPADVRDALNRFNELSGGLFGKDGGSSGMLTADLPGGRFVRAWMKPSFNTKTMGFDYNVRIDFGNHAMDDTDVNPQLQRDSMAMLHKVKDAARAYHSAGFNLEVDAADQRRKDVYARLLKRMGLELRQPGKEEIWYDRPLDPTPYRTAHAPPGGVTIGSKRFEGGEFIPSDVMARATPDEKRAVEGKAPKGMSVGLPARDEPTPRVFAPDRQQLNPQGPGKPAPVARVGVPGDLSPPPPDEIPRLPHLEPDQRAVETRFAEAYLADPDGMAQKYLKALHKRKVGEYPNVFATDDVKMLNPDWNPGGARLGDALPENSKKAMARYNAAVHQTANAVAKRAFTAYLDGVVAKYPEGDPRRRVLVSNGGCAAGKGSSLRKAGQPGSSHAGLLPVPDQVGAIWDAAGEQNATENEWVYNQCRERGIPVTYAYVYADPMANWDSPDKGVIRRALKKGRMVDARLFADSYAVGARNMNAFHESHANAPGAEFVFVDNRDKGNPKLIDGVPPEALQWDEDEIYARAVKVLEDKAPQLGPGIVAGGLGGTKIWGTPHAGGQATG